MNQVKQNIQLSITGVEGFRAEGLGAYSELNAYYEFDA